MCRSNGEGRMKPHNGTAKLLLLVVGLVHCPAVGAQTLPRLTPEGWKELLTKQKESLTSLERRLGKDHWQVTDQRLLLATFEHLSRMSEDNRQRVERALVLGRQAYLLHQQGKFQEGIGAAEEALTLNRKALGEGHHFCS